MSVKASYLFLIIIAAAAILIVFIAVRAYNRRLDKIANGELHDTHSPVPEPNTTVGAAYRTVLLTIVVVLLLTVSAMNGRLSSLQSALNNMQSTQRRLESEISMLREQTERGMKRTASTSWEILSADCESRTCEIEFLADLREYARDTAVSLHLNDRKIPLEPYAAGAYRARFTADMFETCDRAALCITEGDRTTVEETDFPQELFWESLPMPSLSCRFSSDVVMGKMKYDGAYTIQTDHPEDVASVAVTYLSGGRELTTHDLTEATLAQRETELEKGLPLEKDLTFRIEIVTKSGFRIIDQSVMIYETSPDFEDTDFIMILDRDGNTVWENK